MPPEKLFDSKSYWENRYSSGGNSGAGSYGRLAQFKADFLNRFVEANGVTSVTELGVGDGNQLALAKYPSYIGLDVSKTSIALCRKRFAHDETKRFAVIGSKLDWLRRPRWKAELTLSLDVIYHLVEDPVFERYMRLLFVLSRRNVIIYSSDQHGSPKSVHVRDRKFTEWVAANQPRWKLSERTPNEYPYEGNEGSRDTSRSDFFVFEKTS